MRKFLLTSVSLLVVLCVVAQAKFWVCNNDGTQTEFLISNVDSISFIRPMGEVTDVCGNTYRTVKIGSQVWMAENMRCSLYDTDSEAIVDELSIELSTGEHGLVPLSSPYYRDCGKYGYKYNWAAAVAVEYGFDQTHDFGGRRQGVCPNGWHVPTKEEWGTLVDFIEITDGKGKRTAGMHLRVKETYGDDDAYLFSAWDPEGSEYLSFISSSNTAEEGFYSFDLGWGDGAGVGLSGKRGDYGVRCVKNYDTRITPVNKKFDSNGGSYTLSILCSGDWSASSNQSWVTLSSESGYGNSDITITVTNNNSPLATKAVISINSSETVFAYIKRQGVQMPEPKYGPDLIDRQNNTYKTVWIGQQLWMAENLQCTEYDTESEAYNAQWLTENTLPTVSQENGFTPYYVDGRENSLWNENSKEGSVNLSEEQISKFGYLYNWAAAVGVSDGKNIKEPFVEDRQGICPNGWHLPSRDEWNALRNYVESDSEYASGKSTAGVLLKSTSGWYRDGNGIDAYGFNVLPSGKYLYYSGEVFSVGEEPRFWTSETVEDSEDAYCRMIYYDENLLDGWNAAKKEAYSVRCMKN